ncbi:MAG TPA: glutathione S-transferase N-terminal domain-containing protein [Conexibacter sp.]|jgi:glutathione S-transferase|nr:glutathione S-transferase N-terminal domain-containing protein [Conexibacter sp.]
MQARLYGFSISNAANTARLMLDFKGIETKWVEVLPGLHPLLLRGFGFRRGTVPALKLDGRKIEGSLEIAQALEAAVPEPSLYPADPERRRAVEDAERWGEAELQMVPRRIFRWIFAHDNAARAHVARDLGMPLPAVMGALNAPIARWTASRVDADEAHARANLASLRDTLDRVDQLIADGVIGDPHAPNAADFQIAPSIRSLDAVGELAPLFADRPCEALARRLMPSFPDAPPELLAPELLTLAGV